MGTLELYLTPSLRTFSSIPHEDFLHRTLELSRIMKAHLLLVFFLSISLLGCGGTVPNTSSDLPRELYGRTYIKSAWVESTLSQMSLEEKVAQLVFVWTPGKYYPFDSDHWLELERLARDRKLGGFIFSIGDVYEYPAQVNRLQKLAKIPLLITCDLEYGMGMRVRNSTTFPRAMAVGATRNPTFAYEMGRVTAEEAKALGVHQNYAPVADVNTHPKNPVINTRAFGDDVVLVTEMSKAFVRGTQDAGVIATVKHFPGHGDSDIDTHLGMVNLTIDRKRLDELELRPFKESIDAGALSVMVGHISVPAIDTASGIPGTVSPSITTRLLKDELKFDGLIVTDAMVMQGVAKNYAPGQAAVMAIKAGIDLVLMPVNVDLSVDAIVAAVNRGEISQSRIDYSVRKLLQMKQWVGLDKNRFTDYEKAGEVVGSRKNQLIAKEIARNAVTVLGNKNNVLPLPKVDKRTILDIVISDTEDPTDGKYFHGLVKERYGALEMAKVDPRSNVLEYDSAMAKARRADLILCQLHLYTRSGEMTGFVEPKQSEFIKTLLALGKPMVAVSFGNPYVVMDFPKVDTYVCTYSDAECMQEAAAEVLFAEQPATGKLPITIPGSYKFGDGVEYPKSTLQMGGTDGAGFDFTKLTEVDNVVGAAIRDSAFPGAVLLVAKDGMVAYHKAYGTYDYELYSKPVETNTIYDLASVTKVISTTNAVMRLVDEGKINLEDLVVSIIPQFGQNGKEKITLYNLLVHNSGLPAWRKTYEFCTDPKCVTDSVFATPLIYRTGDSTIYSDLGLITLGKVIEKVSGVTLDRYVDSVFFKPLGMKSTAYNPPSQVWNRIAPTEIDTYWQKTGLAVRGRVHDENAATLGGVSGHAGLFSTASDLAILLQMLLEGGTYGGRRYINESTVGRFTQRQSEKSTRAIGWDTKNPTKSWAGSLLSPKTFLHTGFTGTSVAVDPEKNLIVIFLTNRVYPSRSHQKIFEVRPKVHDTIVGALRK